MTENGILLEAKNLTRRFGGLLAVDDVNFTVGAGQIKSIIGPNGAGKTTIFNMLAGAFPPTSGQILFKGKDIAGEKSFVSARLGIGRTFQNVKIFRNMTTLQNVMLARHCRTKTGFLGASLRLPAAIKEEKEITEAAMTKLDFVGIEKRASVPATSLAFGEQKILEVARALALDPSLILLDEPAAGLNTKETAVMAALISRIRDTGITVLLVEHDMSLVMDISDQVLVVDHGHKVTEGAPREVQDNPEVIRIYLGKDFERRNEKK